MSKAQKIKPRLGRGLSSLISVSELPVESEVTDSPDSPEEIEPSSEAIGIEQSEESPQDSFQDPAPPISVIPPADGRPMEVPIDQIAPNPHQPRKSIKESAIAELAVSIKSSGIIQPLVLRRKEDGSLQLIAGERRWLAAKLAGLATVPAVVHDVDSFTQAQMALVENIQREDLNPIERAQGYRALMEQLGLTQAELSIRMGEDRSSIANHLRLLDLAEPVRNMVRDGRLTLGHAKLLAGISDILEQQRLADITVAQSLSVRNLERLLVARTQPAIARKAGSSAAHLADLEKSIARQLGMRAQVRSTGKGRGRLVLHYSSLDQFDDILNRLGVKPE